MTDGSCALEATGEVAFLDDDLTLLRTREELDLLIFPEFDVYCNEFAFIIFMAFKYPKGTSFFVGFILLLIKKIWYLASLIAK